MPRQIPCQAARKPDLGARHDYWVLSATLKPRKVVLGWIWEPAYSVTPGVWPRGQSAENQIADLRGIRIFTAYSEILEEQNSYGCPNWVPEPSPDERT